MRRLQSRYHQLMFKVKSFIYGRHSVKAHKHLSVLFLMGLKRGVDGASRKKG